MQLVFDVYADNVLRATATSLSSAKDFIACEKVRTEGVRFTIKKRWR